MVEIKLSQINNSTKVQSTNILIKRAGHSFVYKQNKNILNL